MREITYNNIKNPKNPLTWNCTISLFNINNSLKWWYWRFAFRDLEKQMLEHSLFCLCELHGSATNNYCFNNKFSLFAILIHLISLCRLHQSLKHDQISLSNCTSSFKILNKTHMTSSNCPNSSCISAFS